MHWTKSVMHQTRKLGFSWARRRTGNSPKLPVWLSILVIVALSALCYWLLYLLVSWLAR
jgi:hypothetical protein